MFLHPVLAFNTIEIDGVYYISFIISDFYDQNGVEYEVNPLKYISQSILFELDSIDKYFDELLLKYELKETLV